MSIRAIAFDLDDTLLRTDGSISGYTVDVLRRAHDRGIFILPASGRTFGSMMKAVPPILPLASALASCNGSEVWSPDGTLLMQELLPVELAHEVAAFAAARGVQFSCSSHQSMLVKKKFLILLIKRAVGITASASSSRI